MKNSDNYVIVFLIIIVIILGLVLFMKSNGIFGSKTNNQAVKQEESASTIKTDVEISSIKERISTIATTFGIASEISDASTYRNLINNKLSQGTKYQIDADYDVTENGKKITNKNNVTLRVTINTNGTVSASFNI